MICAPDQKVSLVFCTTSNDFAAESYELNAQYYLRKPVTRAGLSAMLQRLNPQMLDLVKSVILPDGHPVMLRRILYTDYSNHVVTLYTKDEAPYQLRASQSQMETLLLPYDYFFSPIKGMIINFYETVKLTKDVFVMSCGKTIPSFDRILEVFFYSLLNSLPFIILALYPFRGQLRFGRAGTLLLFFLLTAIQVNLGMMAAFGSSSKALLSGLTTLIYGIFYFTAVKASFGKALFTLLMLSNIANFVVVASKCSERLIFGEFMARQSYRWSYCVCMLVITLFYYFRTYYSDGINKQIGAPA